MFSKKLLRDYFTFGKRDRIGIVSLVILILVIYLLPRLFSRDTGTVAIKDLKIARLAIDSATQKEIQYPDEEMPPKNQFHPGHPKQSLNDFTRGELFEFDPNALPVTGWQRLGLSEKTGHTIENYRNKGGKFYKPEDLNKIWGLPPGFFERVKNYIKIETATKIQFEPGAKPVKKQIQKPLLLDINQSNSGMFELLPGIGPRLAARIVNFREKLGGFYDIGQIAETYGLPDSTFQKIRSSLVLGTVTLHKLSINKATRDELKTHPYLKWPLANSIVEYRNQHGDYHSLEELKRIALIDEVVFNKIAPYLSL
jgi:competence protein ComEA